MKYFIQKFILFTILFVLFIQNTCMINAQDNTDKKSNLKINSESAILIDVTSGTILFDKNMHKKQFPASTTKIMTALIALKNSQNNMLQKINMTNTSIYSLPVGTSHIAMKKDETLTLDESLYAILLASANEVSNAVAEHFAFSSENFAKLMTDEAIALGALNTNFTNAHGLHDNNHFSTAYDLSLIMKEAIKYPDFIKYISTRSYMISPTEKQVEERPLNNSNKMIHQGRYFNEYIIGGKTGFTDNAKHTLVSYAKKDNIELIAVTLKSEKNLSYLDTSSLFDYGFSLFEHTKIYNKNQFSKKIPVLDNLGNLLDDIECTNIEDIFLDLPRNLDFTKIIIKENLPEYLDFDLHKNQSIGKIDIFYNNNLLKNVDIYPVSDKKIHNLNKGPYKADVFQKISNNNLNNNLNNNSNNNSNNNFKNILIIISFFVIFIISTLIILSSLIMFLKKLFFGKSTSKLECTLNKQNFINLRTYKYK